MPLVGLQEAQFGQAWQNHRVLGFLPSILLDSGEEPVPSLHAPSHPPLPLCQLLYLPALCLLISDLHGTGQGGKSKGSCSGGCHFSVRMASLRKPLLLCVLAFSLHHLALMSHPSLVQCIPMKSCKTNPSRAHLCFYKGTRPMKSGWEFILWSLKTGLAPWPQCP